LSEDGYTLAEMLVAIAIIGLAFGGLSESARVLGRMQSGALSAQADARARGGAQLAIERVLAGQGPFLSSGVGGFVAAPDRFNFDCSGGRCGARIDSNSAGTFLVPLQPTGSRPAVRTAARVSFGYADLDGAAWPSADAPARPLRSISLVGADGFPIATWTVSVQEPAGCVFDVVAQGCRAAP
jgi:prepilin-type N-terminal cleavage/methylation domain-containing protein